MGTDIHGVFQKRTADGWEDVPSHFEENRHYFLFSILADVRNGFGFAGVPTYSPVEPISKPRGLPADFAMSGEAHPIAASEVLGWRQKYRDEDDPLEVWMGDHSHSWLDADEILAYVAKRRDATRQCTGVIPIANYREWDKTSPPDSYSGDVWGRDVVVSLPAEITPQTTHVRVSWVRGGMDDIQYFTDEIQRLKDEHGEVRFVFGFDS